MSASSFWILQQHPTPTSSTSSKLKFYQDRGTHERQRHNCVTACCSTYLWNRFRLSCFFSVLCFHHDQFLSQMSRRIAFSFEEQRPCWWDACSDFSPMCWQCLKWLHMELVFFLSWQPAQIVIGIQICLDLRSPVKRCLSVHKSQEPIVILVSRLLWPFCNKIIRVGSDIG